jgi:hypothetical protein
MASYIQLQTNVPVNCTLAQVSLAPGQGTWPDGRPKQDQVVVAGNFEGNVSKVFLPLPLEGELKKIGVIGDRNGNGSYSLLKPGAQLRFTKREDGKSKFTTVELVGQGQVTAQARTAPATTTPPGAGKDQWDRLVYTMGLAARAALKIWKDAGVEGFNESVAATAHSLFIEANRSGLNLTPPVPVKNSQLELIAEFSKKLNWEEAKLVNYLAERFGIKDPKQLTEGAASSAIAELQEKVINQPEDVPF